MTNRIIYHIKRLLIFLLSIFSFCVDIASQESISGVINKYAKVNSIGPGYVIVTPEQASQFSPHDYVLLMQMQGVGIQTGQNVYGLNVQTLIGIPGASEFLRINDINYVLGQINFTRNVYINNTYNVAGNVQLIQVPFYDSPTVTAPLVCQSWDPSNGTGGVLAMLVGKKLILNADIDVTGLGFMGGAGSPGIGECINSNESLNGRDSYPDSWNNAGYKGEGIAIHDDSNVLLFPDHAKGQGRNLTGGGGGNGLYSGGGGGSNRGRGWDGGLEISSLCGGDPRFGGFGGISIIDSPVPSGIFPGGGGGSSTQASGSIASAGGNGGGIVIIVADTIEGNNHFIRSDGASALNAVSNAGAGGGGGGGSSAISYRSFSSPVNISSRGGNGGENTGGFGEGGGGGGGLIWLSSSSMPDSVTSASVDYGIPAPGNPTGGSGEIKFHYSPQLNGFLFNSICSKATGNRIDSVCSNILYGQITGTQPVGGTPPYIFQWQSSTDGLNWVTASGTNDEQDYMPPELLNQTTWFRRIITDNSTPGIITDISLPVRIIVHPLIKNNVIGNSDELCYGQNASELNSLLTLEDGNGEYTYRWELSFDNESFTDVPATTESYLPPNALIQTTWYRRTVRSGSCIDISAPIMIRVLDTVRNNSILSLPQEICEGMNFDDLEGTATPVLGGGDNTYRFRWESSTDGSDWVTATGVADEIDYNPAESAGYFPGSQYFRRIVLSGSNDVCRNISKPVLLSQYPLITNNSIAPAEQTSCSGSSPVQLTGTMPLNGKGAGSYTFTWQDSTKDQSWTDISGFIGRTDPDFIPPVLTDTTWYRRLVFSSVCIDISQPVSINVHKPVTNNDIHLLAGGLGDTTICSGGTPHKITGTVATGGTNLEGSYLYQWFLSSDNIIWTEISGAEGTEYQPSSLESTTWFRRRAVSGQCSSESGPVKITVLPVINNNTISGDQIICKSDVPEVLTQAPGISLMGGSGLFSYFWEQSTDGNDWIPAEGINNQSDGTYQPPLMTRSIKYRRRVTSGAMDCCTSISNQLELVMDSLPVGSTIYAGPDTAIFSFDYIVQLVADPAFPGGTGKWTVVNGTGSFENDSDNDTRISGLSRGLNTYLWTVTRGACKMEDEVSVTIYNMVIPEGFSPNNDPEGYNNTFKINGLDLDNQSAELTIINGAGTEVFQTTNLRGNEWIDWDGKNSNGADLPEGAYYYLLKLISKGNGMVFKKSGFVILKRY